MKPYHPTLRSRLRSDGFALIITISLMLVITLLSVGLLSLSSLALRSSSRGDAQARARSNARIALMLAIGELQKFAGPDQRVTARAEIKDDADPSKRYWTGIWDTRDWNPRDPDKREFLGWMVSSPDDSENQSEDHASSPLTGDDLITLVGEGSTIDPEAHVKVREVKVATDGRVTGSYAYWVSDEASKASFAVPVDDDPVAWNEASIMGVPRHTALEVLDEALFNDYADKVKIDAMVGHAPSYKTLDLLTSGEAGDASSRFFHDLTNRSLSLLTNTRSGGIKSDLSTAFELELAEFNAIEEFHNSKERNDTSAYRSLSRRAYTKMEFYPTKHKLGYLFEIPFNRKVVRGPTWDLLRNHYRLYKKEWEALDWPRSFAVSDRDTIAARGSLPLSYSTSWGEVKGRFSKRASPGGIYGNSLRHNSWANYKDLAEGTTRGAFKADTGTTRSTAARISPLIVRISMVIGVRKKQTNKPAPDNWRLAISFDPYVTIVNPYNRAIEFESIGMYSAKFNPLRFKFEFTNDAGTRTILEDLQFSHNTGTNGSIAYRLLPEKGEIFRLEPGEVRVMSPKKSATNSGTEIKLHDRNFAEATFDYTEDSGLFIYPGRYRFSDDPLPVVPVIRPKTGTSVTLTMTGRYPGSFASHAGETLIFTQHLSKDHNGRTVKLDKHMPPYMQANHDVFDDSLITRLTYATYDGKVGASSLNRHKLYSKVTINETSIPDVGESGLYVGVLDIRMKHGGEDAPSFHHFNPRGQVFDPRNYDGSDRLGPAWKIGLKRITDISDLELVADPHGHGFWGSGIGASSGTSKVVLFDIPRAPLTSLASLSQADIAVLPSSGTNLIGNSFTNPGLKNLSSLADRRNLVGDFTTKAPQVQADFSWAANEAIWDQYFFSGINWGSASLAYESGAQTYGSQNDAVTALTSDKSTARPLANPRIQYLQKGGETDPEDELKDYARIGNYLAIIGGFNVNSTSVEAWRAVLSGLRDEEVKYLTASGNVNTNSSNVPFSRFLLPAGDSSDDWSGFRNLDDQDIEKLAEAMVQQVKSRGPFMGLSDFVNRRLSAGAKNGSDVGKLGAMQMAIESAGLNRSVGRNVGIRNMENSSIRTGGGSMQVSTMTGTPGYLMQADILTSIGSILRTRSDTFVIRAYGDAKDKNGKVLARAWCEATIQRTPEWTEETDEPAKILDQRYPNMRSDTIVDRWVDNPTFPENNRTYGRRMNIVSFRWLAANEV